MKKCLMIVCAASMAPQACAMLRHTAYRMVPIVQSSRSVAMLSRAYATKGNEGDSNHLMKLELPKNFNVKAGMLTNPKDRYPYDLTKKYDNMKVDLIGSQKSQSYLVGIAGSCIVGCSVGLYADLVVLGLGLVGPSVVFSLCAGVNSLDIRIKTKQLEYVRKRIEETTRDDKIFPE